MCALLLAANELSSRMSESCSDSFGLVRVGSSGNSVNNFRGYFRFQNDSLNPGVTFMGAAQNSRQIRDLELTTRSWNVFREFRESETVKLNPNPRNVIPTRILTSKAGKAEAKVLRQSKKCCRNDDKRSPYPTARISIKLKSMVRRGSHAIYFIDEYVADRFSASYNCPLHQLTLAARLLFKTRIPPQRIPLIFLTPLLTKFGHSAASPVVESSHGRFAGDYLALC